MFHVPGSTRPSDEFLAPTGQWLSTYRAITYDGWMLWKDALPDVITLWGDLGLAAYENISLLAKRIHVLHQNVENYRRLDESPFCVSRWWDPLHPEGGDEHWQLGRHVLLRITSMNAKQFMAIPQRRNQLHIKPVTTNWMEVTLPLEVSKGLPEDDELLLETP